jgi:SAM-dependent methyltransferase
VSTPAPLEPIDRAVLDQLSLSARDLPTRDKVPVIQSLMPADQVGLALDIGLGTGFTTYSTFRQRPTVCVDIDRGNLKLYRDRLGAIDGSRRPMCVAAIATALPFRDGAFQSVLCSEVLEHLEDDDRAVAEIARVLAPDGAGVITVPYTGLGFTGFLEVLGVPTVHDFPGPERHVRPGYDEPQLRALMARHGLQVADFRYFFRFFTRLATDFVSVLHIIYQRLVHGRRSWTWADVASDEGRPALRAYTLIFPLLWAFSRLDVLLRSWRGFGIVALIGQSGRTASVGSNAGMK